MDTPHEERLTHIFRTLFNQPDLMLRETLTSADVAGWDSFNHVSLIIQIEQEFGIRFTNEEVNSFQNVGDLVRTIEAKLA